MDDGIKDIQSNENEDENFDQGDREVDLPEDRRTLADSGREPLGFRTSSFNCPIAWVIAGMISRLISRSILII